MLHGGASRRGNMRVSPTQLSVLRMIPIAGRIARDGHGRLAVFRLLNSTRGWDTNHTPVADAHWALQQIRNQHGRLPTAIVGHSLGGRAARLSAAEPEVAVVVALAPCVYPFDRPAGADRRILIVHGSADRIANAKNAATVAQALARANQVSYVRVDGEKHAMLRRHNVFDGLASDFVTGSLLNDKRHGVAGRALRGEPLMDV